MNITRKKFEIWFEIVVIPFMRNFWIYKAIKNKAE